MFNEIKISLILTEKRESTCKYCAHTKTTIEPTKVWEIRIPNYLDKVAHQVGMLLAIWHPNCIVPNRDVKAEDICSLLEDGTSRIQRDTGCYGCESEYWDELSTLAFDYYGACKKYPQATIQLRR